MRTLVLNAGYEPMVLINWQRAICLVLSEKAEIVAEYDRVIRTVSASYPLPSVVRLTNYVRVLNRFGIVRCSRKNIILRDRYQCQYCGVLCNMETISIDHVIPRCKGGRTTWENVVAACHDCNRKKGDQSLVQVGMALVRLPKQPSWRELMGEVDFPMEADWLRYLDYAS